MESSLAAGWLSSTWNRRAHRLAIMSPRRAAHLARSWHPGMQYETDAYCATTGFATLEEAATKATRYMVEYLVGVRGMSREDAYMLCSLAGNLETAEAVDKPNMLVVIHLPKSIFATSR